MKRIIAFTLIAVLCFTMVSCGKATLSGDLTVFTNAAKSFSIELPAEETEDKDKATWIINEETSADILDMTNSAETVRVVIQGVSKAKVSRLAKDFEGYKTYVTETAFAELLKGATMKDATYEVPEFVKNSVASTYTIKGAEGAIVFMETDKCYYTYLVVTAEGAFNPNEKIIQQSVLSLKELTEATPVEETKADETQATE